MTGKNEHITEELVEQIAIVSYEAARIDNSDIPMPSWTGAGAITRYEMKQKVLGVLDSVVPVMIEQGWAPPVESTYANGLPGNHHAEEAVRYACEASVINNWTDQERLVWAQLATTYANLALAYEQRTANMIDGNRPTEIDFTGWPKEIVGRFSVQAIDIAKRLGMGETK